MATIYRLARTLRPGRALASAKTLNPRPAAPPSPRLPLSLPLCNRTLASTSFCLLVINLVHCYPVIGYAGVRLLWISWIFLYERYELPLRRQIALTLSRYDCFQQCLSKIFVFLLLDSRYRIGEIEFCLKTVYKCLPKFYSSMIMCFWLGDLSDS